MNTNPGFFQATVPAKVPVKIVEHLNKEDFRNAVPKQVQGRINSVVMRDINDVLLDPVTREHFRENFITYTGVLKEGKHQIGNYISAVKYVSYKLLGHTNKDAYAKTFPDRQNLLVTEGASEKTISAYVAAYNKNKLVNQIWEQTLIPTHVLNADVFQQAINTQVNLMTTADSEKVRTDAANSLLNALKQPETQKVQLDIAIKDDNSIEELRLATAELAATQKEMIKAGLSTVKKIAHSQIVIDHEP